MACTTPPGEAPPVSPPPAFTVLPRDRSPLARPEFDRGRRDAAIAASGSIYFRPSPEQQADRASLLEAIVDPASPRYHAWLGAEQYAARFGARAADVARTTRWLESEGLVVDGPSRTGSRLAFHGTTGQVEQAFHTEIHDYVIEGAKHFAMSRAPSVPTELASVVLALRGFHDFRPHRRRHLSPGYDDGQFGLTLDPADFAVLYDTAPLLAAGTDGKGVNLVVVGQTYYTPADVAGFRSTFGLTTSQTDVLVPGTGTQAVNDVGDLEETELDLEWASAVAPGANIIFVYTGNNSTNYGVYDAVAYTIEQGDLLAPGVGNGGAQIISESYAGCEPQYPADADIDSEIADAANLEGITFIAGSGDWGAAGCFTEGIGGLFVGPPASLPGVTSVGGTEFPPGAQALAFSNDVATGYPVMGGLSLETVWNDSMAGQLGATGGGVSILFPKPAYQQGITPNDGARDVPDVSLTASAQNVPYTVEVGGKLVPIGGTSAATPSFAGIIALVNQAVFAAGGSLGLGNVNPMLYALYKSSPSAFHDIVSGNNDTPCTPGTDPGCPASGDYGGYPAAPGYDLASGLGTIDAANLVHAWMALSPTTTALSASPTVATVNTKVTLTATVTSSATANAMSGSVSFTFVTLAGSAGAVYEGDSGGPDESWLLGTVAVTAGSGGATASLSTEIPPGLYGQVELIAMYGGDEHYLASSSSRLPLAVTGSTLAVSPATITLAPGEQTTFTTTGGAPPILWAEEGTDTTCSGTNTSPMGEQCSQVESKTATTAFFQAGPAAGSVTLVAIDTQGQEALVRVVVAGTPVDAGPFPKFDAGAPGGPGGGYVDGATLPTDASFPADEGPADDGGLEDASGADTGSSPVDGGRPSDAGQPGRDAGAKMPAARSGCSCVAAGARTRTSDEKGGPAVGLLLCLAVIGRLRRSPAGRRDNSPRHSTGRDRPGHLIFRDGTPHATSPRAEVPVMKSSSVLRAVASTVGVLCLGALGCQPSHPATTATAETTSAQTERGAIVDRIGDAAAVVRDVGAQIPPDVARRTRCVAVIPAMMQGGFVVGARHGKGFASCRQAAGWSAPAPVQISGGTIGLQIGLESSDLIMLFTNDLGMDKLLRDKFALGTDASAAAGPVGRGREASTDASFRATVLTYSRSRGLFAGADLGGAVLEQDHDDTTALYGVPTDFRSLLTGRTPAPGRAWDLLGALGTAFPPPQS